MNARTLQRVLDRAGRCDEAETELTMTAKGRLMTDVAIGTIKFDAGTQVRAAIDESVVAEYAERMAEGATFPPIVLFHDGNHYYLADGFHRAMASQRLGLAEIASEIRPGTKTDALWFALGANKANAHRMSKADIKHALALALQTWGGEGGKSVRLIAEQVGCALSYAQRIESQLTTRGQLPARSHVTGKDGKSYQASRPSAGSSRLSDEKRVEIERRIEAGENVHDIAKAVRSSANTVGKIARDLGRHDKSKAAIAQRRKDIAEMAERGYTTRQIAGAVGVGEESVTNIAKREGIVIHADRVVGKTRRIDSNRIVDQMVMDAENLTADENLIDFADLDPARLVAWVASLESSSRSLRKFITRLKEQQKHGEAA